MTHSHRQSTRHAQRGFTLVELAIVLVIIGLIVGGVLVGQDLIRAAEVRATVGQIEKYNAAINTFRTKYNGIPGDLAETRATSFGVFDVSVSDGTQGLRDGNGLLQATAVAGTMRDFIGETQLFWNDLSDASLLDGNFVATGAAAAYTSGALDTVIPNAKVGRGNRVAVFSSSGFNFYQILGISSISGAGVYTGTNNLTPAEALNMDEKIDDGLPATGSIVARSGAGNTANLLDTASTVGAGGAAAAFCTNSTPTPNTYNTQNESLLCSLRFRFN